MDDFFDNIWDGILAFLKDAYEWALPVVKATLQRLVSGGGAMLMDAALAAVKAAEETGKSGDEKWEMAFNAVKGTVESEGREVVNSAINLAIEMALAKMQQK